MPTGLCDLAGVPLYLNFIYYEVLGVVMAKKYRIRYSRNLADEEVELEIEEEKHRDRYRKQIEGRKER